MIENFKQKEEEIITTISNIKNNKNPLNVFFIISDLKKLFGEIGDSLLNGLNIEYSKNFESIYQNIIDKYKSVETFEETYAYYINTHSLGYFKSQIDNYFENSFFIDLSFFYYTLSFDDTYYILFSILQTFYLNEEIKEKFYSFQTYKEQLDFLKTFNPNIDNIKYEKNKILITTFLNEISLINLEEIEVQKEINDPNFVIDLMKNLTIYIFENKDVYLDCYEFIINQFVNNKHLSNEIINNFEEEKLLKVIAFLRNDLLSVMDSDMVLSYSRKKEINKFLWEYKTYEMLSVEEKTISYINRQDYLKSLNIAEGNFIRLYLKRKFLEENYTNIIDLSIGVLFLPQEIFYQYKLNLKQEDISELSLYNQIKELILYIEDSYFLSFFRPFLLQKLSYFFNNSSQKYYIIKFMLLIILSNSYTEYEKLQRFFYNLEIFFKQDIISFFKKCLLFGWIVILFLVLYAIAPFGVLLSVLIVLGKEIFLKMLGKINPALKLSLNFQINTAASLLAIVSLILGTTIGLDVNSKLMYSKFRATINALTLNSAESTKIIGNSLSNIKSDILGSQNITTKTSSGFDDIDLYKSGDVTKAVNKLNPLNQISNVIDKINPPNNDEFSQAALNDLFTTNEINSNEYTYVILNKNHTFWDYGIEIAIKNGIDIHSNDFNKKLSNWLEIFLTENKSKLLKYIPNQNIRLGIWDIPKYLPEIYFDLSGLEKIIKENK